jgi:membrane protein DedA with SNARE-associated domain
LGRIRVIGFVDIASLIQHYGYAAIVLGTFLEGETVLVLGGLAAHLGYLSFPGVIGAAFAGAIIGDQTFFFLGRRNGQAWLLKRPNWQKRAQRVLDLLHRHRIPLILGFRFVYGIRAVTPFVLGMSRVPYWQFALFNVIGAAAWATTVGTAAFFLGKAIEPYLGQIRHYELRVFGALAIVALVYAAFHLHRIWRRR